MCVCVCVCVCMPPPSEWFCDDSSVAVQFLVALKTCATQCYPLPAWASAPSADFLAQIGNDFPNFSSGGWSSAVCTSQLSLDC